MDETKLLYTVDEALELLSLGRTKFYQEVKDGRIRLAKAGGKALVARSELEAYVTRLLEAAGKAQPETKQPEAA